MRVLGWLCILLLLGCAPAHSFCGFYVASGEAKLFNHASQVALVRDGDRTVMTIASDYRGDPQQFALVVPVPVVLERGQIHAGDSTLVGKLDAFSAPRLVEYFDPNPCAEASDLHLRGGRPQTMMQEISVGTGRITSDRVRVEARYQVAEYEIVILSASQSDALERWLVANGYAIPAGAARALEAYVRQGMKFFVAKVNLKEQARLGFRRLRPLQIAYESPKFMLPVRLGMLNADGPQELIVYAITRTGRVEPVNYRSVKLPSDAEVPEYVKADFPRFYRDLFEHQTNLKGMGVVFTEYFWNMSWCDPCASPPLSDAELRELGVTWLGEAGAIAFITRLHARYDRASFPEDLVLQVTSDQQNFQGRFVVRHEWKGTQDCAAIADYRAKLRERRAQQANTVIALTGWSIADVRTRMNADADWTTPADRRKWWDELWPR